MAPNLPSFSNPPLAEVALGLQFDPIPGLTSAHLGVFWAQISELFPTTTDAIPLEPLFEKFGEDSKFSTAGTGLRTRQIAPGTRLQAVDRDGVNMVQLQRDRIVFNWRRKGRAEYPRWESLINDFAKVLEPFKMFLKNHDFQGLSLTQWEVIYVNYLRKPGLWESASQWPEVLPGIIGLAKLPDGLLLDSLHSKYSFLLPNDSGRLHAEAIHGYVTDPGEEGEAIILKFTARGGIPANDPNGLGSLGVGHEVIVKAFASVAGNAAKTVWGVHDAV